MPLFSTFFLAIIPFINTIEEELRITELNSMETIDNNQKFIIKTNETSIAYFDSFDKCSVIYISKEIDDESQYERINGKFYQIEKNIDYYVKNNLYFKDCISVYKKYLYPLNLEQKEIDISENTINFLYLEKDKVYYLKYENHLIRKIIKLSRRTLMSIVKIKLENSNEEIELNETNLYYQIKENFIGKIKVEIKENDAFLEFLYNVKDDNDFELLENEKELQISKNKINAIIEYNQKDFTLKLESKKPFSFSFSCGFSNNKNLYYDSSSNNNIQAKKYESNYIGDFILYGIFKNITLMENEIFSILIKITKSESNQIIKLYFYQQKEDFMDIDEKDNNIVYFSNVIKNLQNLVEGYVFSDIAQNPPEIKGHKNYHHRKINLAEELGNIEIYNRKFYEFYQDILKVLTTVKDNHFSIFTRDYLEGDSSTKFLIGHKLSNYRAILPFKFIIRLYDGKYRLFIEKNDFTNRKLFTDETGKFINSHLNIPLKTINDVDPFDYIQNWSKFRKPKNKHAEFTYIIEKISDFNIKYFPLNFSDLTLNDYEFEDNKLLRVGYQFINEYKEDSINYKVRWNNGKNFQHLQNKIKYRVDDINRVNVIIQHSFKIDNKAEIISFLASCMSAFNKNKYPIIIIESRNRGGSAVFANLMSQYLQPNLTSIDYISYKCSNLMKELHGSFCNNLKEFDDKYDNIQHIRTEAIPNLKKEDIEALLNYRENHRRFTRKPTDIIIFTDSYSFSATSVLIKNFQRNGGAIVAGFYGNPKIEGTYEFDGSQSPSGCESMKNTKIYHNLDELGFILNGVTLMESYEFYPEDIGQIPQEYTFNEVDYRSDIYEDYTDDNYDLFIQEAKKIFKKFNEENYCNSHNKRLLLQNKNCKNGGYICGDNNEWTKTCDQNQCSQSNEYYDNSKKNA